MDGAAGALDTFLRQRASSPRTFREVVLATAWQSQRGRTEEEVPLPE